LLLFSYFIGTLPRRRQLHPQPVRWRTSADNRCVAHPRSGVVGTGLRIGEADPSTPAKPGEASQEGQQNNFASSAEAFSPFLQQESHGLLLFLTL